jgi:hypothetical protein
LKPIIKTILFLIAIAVLPSPVRVNAQDPLDGPNRIFNDDLLNNLVGAWKLKREIRSRTAENTVTVEWVLNHQFLRIHMKDVKKPPTYEAMVFVGFDNTSERYVVHWIDVFGGRFSETLGYGTRSGNSIKFVFEYPDGPFHNTFTWTPETKSWRFLMEQKNKAGMWVKFAEDTLTRP